VVFVTRFEKGSSIAGFIIGCALLVLAASRLDSVSVLNVIKRVSLWPWLPLALLCYLLSHFARGMRCKVLVSSEAALSLAAATNVVVLGYAVNNLLPARLGEFARAGMLSDRTGLPYAQTLAVTVLERVLDGLALLFLLTITISSSQFPFSGLLLSALPLGAVLFAILFSIVLILRLFPGFILSLNSKLTHPLGLRVHDRVVTFTHQMIQGMSYLRGPAELAFLAVLSLSVWTLEAGMYLYLLPAFGLNLHVWTAFFAMTVTNLGMVLPSTPGFVGVFHFLCMRSLQAIHVPGEIALSYATLVHLVFYIPITIWGVAIAMFYHIRITNTAALVRSASPFSTSINDQAVPGRQILDVGKVRRKPDTPSQFMTAVVETIIPGLRELPDPKSSAVQVATFVQGQINCLPARLRILLHIGLSGFAALTWMRHISRFENLSFENRRRWLYAWSFGRFSLARHLFRPFRTAMLAYYDLPEVEAAHLRV